MWYHKIWKSSQNLKFCWFNIVKFIKNRFLFEIKPKPALRPGWKNFQAFPTIGRVFKSFLSPGRVLVWLLLARRLNFTMQNCKIPSFWGITAPFEGLAWIWGDQLIKSKVTRIQFCYYLSLCINNLLPKNLKNFTKSQFLMI